MRRGLGWGFLRTWTGIVSTPFMPRLVSIGRHGRTPRPFSDCLVGARREPSPVSRRPESTAGVTSPRPFRLKRPRPRRHTPPLAQVCNVSACSCSPPQEIMAPTQRIWPIGIHQDSRCIRIEGNAPHDLDRLSLLIPMGEQNGGSSGQSSTSSQSSAKILATAEGLGQSVGGPVPEELRDRASFLLPTRGLGNSFD